MTITWSNPDTLQPYPNLSNQEVPAAAASGLSNEPSQQTCCSRKLTVEFLGFLSAGLLDRLVYKSHALQQQEPRMNTRRRVLRSTKSTCWNVWSRLALHPKSRSSVCARQCARLFNGDGWMNLSSCLSVKGEESRWRRKSVRKSRHSRTRSDLQIWSNQLTPHLTAPTDVIRRHALTAGYWFRGVAASGSHVKTSFCSRLTAFPLI